MKRQAKSMEKFSARAMFFRMPSEWKRLTPPPLYAATLEDVGAAFVAPASESELIYILSRRRTCGNGHIWESGCVVLERSRNGRQEVVKCGRCGWLASEFTSETALRLKPEKGVGFLRPGFTSPGRNTTLVKVLTALTSGEESIHNLVVKTGLSWGQVDGVLRRSMKRGLVVRRRVAVIPEGKSFFYGLTVQGKEAQAWYKGHGR